MEIDLNKLEALLAEKNYDEARKVIHAAISAPMPDSEKGAILVGLSSAYLDISNAINTLYRDALTEAIKGMKAINAAESKSNDNIRVMELKSSLNDL